MSRLVHRLALCSEAPPSYQESITPVTRDELPNNKRRNDKIYSLLDRIANTRARRIDEVITDIIDPALESIGFDAVLRQIIVLVPSDTLSGRTPSPSKIVHPTSLGSLQMIHLRGEDHRASFWEQSDVIAELERRLKSRLGVQMASETRTDEPVSRTPHKSSLKKADRDPTASTGKWELGWRTEPGTLSSEKAIGIDISVNLQEISVRTESELGLWLTETFKGVWIVVDIRA